MFKVKMQTLEQDYESPTKLMIVHNGEVKFAARDGGEPEDQTFARDWNWVPGAIELAYKLGREDTATKVKAALAELIRKEGFA